MINTNKVRQTRTDFKNFLESLSKLNKDERDAFAMSVDDIVIDGICQELTERVIVETLAVIEDFA